MEKETKKNMDKIRSGGDVPQRTLNCRKTRGLFMAKAQSHRKRDTEDVPTACSADNRLFCPGWLPAGGWEKDTASPRRRGRGHTRGFKGRGLWGQQRRSPSLPAIREKQARETVVCFPHQGETGGRRQVGTDLLQAGPLRQGALCTRCIRCSDQRGV